MSEFQRDYPDWAFAYDIDGRLLWTRDLGELDTGSVYSPERQWGVASSPILDGTRVIVILEDGSQRAVDTQL